MLLKKRKEYGIANRKKTCNGILNGKESKQQVPDTQYPWTTTTNEKKRERSAKDESLFLFYISLINFLVAYDN